MSSPPQTRPTFPFYYLSAELLFIWADEDFFQYKYVFVCVGMVLMFMVILHALTLTKYRWRPLDYIRVGFFVLASLFLGFVPVVIPGDAYVPVWALPVICGTVFLLFLITHLRWPRRLHRPRPKRLRLSSSKSIGQESKSLFASSVYHFDTHGQGTEYHSNGGLEVDPPRDYISLQNPEDNGYRMYV